MVNPHQKVLNGVVHPSYINSRLKVKFPLHNFVSYAQAVTQQKKIKNCMKSTSVAKAATTKNTNGTMHPSIIGINYPLCFFANYFQLITHQYKSRRNQ